MELLRYGFIINGLEAGCIVAIIAPLVGIFLVLRRYSLIADTLSHVSLAGVAIGLLIGINPLATAVIATLLASVGIERLRIDKKIYGESALAIFLSGSLALAIVLISAARGFSVDVMSYLFGSIITVKQSDVVLIVVLGCIVIFIIAAFYKELIYITFDETAARISGIPIGLINTLFILAAGLMVAVSMPVVGILLISALAVIPVIAALQFQRNFLHTIFISQGIALISVVLGVFASFYTNTATGGTIVLIALGLLLLVFAGKQIAKPQRNI